MKILLPLLFIALFLTSYSQPRKLAFKGIDLQKNGKIKEAIDNYNKFLAFYEGKDRPYDRDYIAVLANRASAYAEYHNGKYYYIDSCMADYTTLIAIDSQNPAWLYSRATLYTSTRQYEKGIVDFTAFFSLMPEQGKIQKQYVINNEQGDINTQDGGVDNFTMYVSSLNHRADCYSWLKRHKEAIADCDKALKLIPEDLYALSIRSVSLEGIGEYPLALNDIERSLSIDSNRKWLLMRQGDDYYAIKNYSSAIKSFSNAILLSPKDTLAYLSRAVSFSALKKYDEALVDITKAISMSNHYLDAKMYKCALHQAMGMYDSAIKDAEAFFAETPVRSTTIQAIINIDNNKFKAAQLNYKYLKDHHWEDSLSNRERSYIIAGVQFLPEKKYGDALKVLLKLSREQEDFILADTNKDIPMVETGYANVLAKAGWVYGQAGEEEMALTYYRKAQLINPLIQNVTVKIDSLVKRMQAERDTDSVGPAITLLKTTVDSLRKLNSVDKTKNTPFYVSGVCKDISGVKWIKINGNDIGGVNSEGFFGTYMSLTGIDITIKASDNKGNISSQVFKIQKSDRGVDYLPEQIREISEKKQTFHAIIIACSMYYDLPGLPDLHVSVVEAKKLENVLIEKYGFKKSNIREVFDSPYEDITFKLTTKVQSLTDQDDLLIFYAGHGTALQNKEGTNIGFWIPGKSTDTNRYISNIKLDKILSHSNARHVLIIADACMGAAMMGSHRELTPDEKMTNRFKSRQIMTSSNWGDSRGDGFFVDQIIKVLEDDSRGNIMAVDLMAEISLPVRNAMGTTPILSNFGWDGHDGGQFIFRKK